MSALDERATELAGALRRSVPALLRRGVSFQPSPGRVTRIAELTAEIPGPLFEVPLVTDPGGSRALLCFSGPATAYLVDAALGGNGELDPDEASPKEISSPQRAVAARIAGEMVGSISDVLSSLGLRLRKLPANPEAHFGGELVVVTFRIGDAADRVIALAMSRDAIQACSAGAKPAPRSPDISARVAGVLGQVEVDIIVELGRVRRSLMGIERLRVGDVIRLPTPVRSPLVVRCQERPVFVALPTTVGTQLAISILDRVDSGRATSSTERAGAAGFTAQESEP